METVYTAVKRTAAEFLSRESAFNVNPEHIICPSREGDISTAMCMMYGIDPCTAVTMIKNALSIKAPELYGKTVFKEVWASGAYINFSLTDDFIYTAARKIAQNITVPNGIERLESESDYIMARAAELCERGAVHGVPADNDTAHTHALWLGFGLLEERVLKAHVTAFTQAALNTLTAFPLQVPRGVDIREYSEWILKMLSAWKNRSDIK